MAQDPLLGEDVSLWKLIYRPAIGLKRWSFFIFVGFMLMGLGLLILFNHLSRTELAQTVLYWTTLQMWPFWVRSLLFVTVGLLVVLYGAWRLHAILFGRFWPELRRPENVEAINTLLRSQRRREGPKIVAIGGGTGMPQLLRGLRKYTDNITAIVTVADDGGSSGQLRRSLGMLPPGDFRNNIAALSDDAEGLMKRLFQYRFAESDVGSTTHPNELAGHSFGNLFITTMAAVTGSFEAAISESSKVLRVRGRVLPSTLENVTLCAEVRRSRADGSEEWVIVEGESKLPKAEGQIERVFLNPEQARAYPEAIRALLQADLIVAGPGSFFTSVMPNLLVRGVRDAISAAPAPRIYICNVATQAGETDGFSVADHMRKLREHAGDAFTMVLANDSYDPEHPPSENSQWVTLPLQSEALDFCLFTGDVTDSQQPWRHDSDKLAARLMAVYATLKEQAANPGKVTDVLSN